jgi:hypothetical protein
MKNYIPPAPILKELIGVDEAQVADVPKNTWKVAIVGAVNHFSSELSAMRLAELIKHRNLR